MYPSLHFHIAQCGPWTSPMISRPTSRCQYFFGHHNGHLGFCLTTLSSMNEFCYCCLFACFYIFTHSSLLSLISSKVLMTQKQFSLSLSLCLFLLHTHMSFYGKNSKKGFYPKELFLCRGWEKTFEDTKARFNRASGLSIKPTPLSKN